MNILYIGDIFGEPGIKAVSKALNKIKNEHSVDLVIAQGENVSDGRGISNTDFNRLKKLGIDFFTGGNWSLNIDDIVPALNDPNQPIIRPANYQVGTPGLGYKYIDTKDGKVLIISLLGKIVGRDADKAIDNPINTVDQILESESKIPRVAAVVNFHGDYSSEKLVIGQYLDGRISIVVGDHWHIPTADAMTLPKGTAHITDVGMCGTISSSLGVKTNIIIDRWRDNKVLRNETELEGPLQFNALLTEVDNSTGLAISTKLLQEKF